MAFVGSSFAIGQSRFTPFGASKCNNATSRRRMYLTKPSRGASNLSMRVYNVQIELYGEKYTIPIDEGLTLLEGIEEYGLSVPYSCRAGVCITCAAKVLQGTVDPGEAAITDELKDNGYVLTCSAYPNSEGLVLEMNQFEDAYDQQYGRYEAK